MKKIVTLGFTLLATVTLAACGNSSSSKKDSSSSSQNVHKVSTQKSPTKYFKNNVLKMTDIKMTITKELVIKPGDKGNEYGKKPVFAIWFDLQNTSNKKITPLDVIPILEATQEGDSTDRKLDVGISPDQKMTDIQDDVIKKGKTSKGAIAYELKDTKTPVVLTASATTNGATIGKQTYNIK